MTKHEKNRLFEQFRIIIILVFTLRPWIHHIRWIENDKNTKGFLFFAMEINALVQSHDGGKTWKDPINKSHVLFIRSLA
jgi:hypothetical protein